MRQSSAIEYPLAPDTRGLSRYGRVVPRRTAAALCARAREKWSADLNQGPF